MEGVGWLSGETQGIWVGPTTPEGTPSHTPALKCFVCRIPILQGHLCARAPSLTL